MTIPTGAVREVKDTWREAKRWMRHWKNTVTDRRPKLLVLVYHRVLPDCSFNPVDTVVSVRTFVRQLNRIARSYPLLSLSTALRGNGVARRGATRVVLTFDDGYLDNFEFAFPVLQKKSVPAAFFLATNYVNGDRPLWDWEILIRALRGREVPTVTIGEHRIEPQRSESRIAFALRLLERLKAAPLQETQQVLDGLRQQADHGAHFPDAMERCMTWEQVRTMSRQGMEVGSHSASHRSLARIPLPEALAEVQRSKETIEREVGTPCAHFAFPFGSRRDYNDTLIRGVKATGFRACLLNIHGYNHAEHGTFCFKRIIMTESTNVAHLLG